MTLYEINTKLEELLDNITVDEETGEVLIDTQAIEDLTVARDEKIEGTACYIKNMTNMIADMKQEEANLKARRTALEKKLDNLSNYLQYTLQGQKFETAKCKISYRKSTKTEIPDEQYFVTKNPDFVTYETKAKINKTDVKKAIQSGVEVDGAKLVENINMVIK